MYAIFINSSEQLRLLFTEAIVLLSNKSFQIKLVKENIPKLFREIIFPRVDDAEAIKINKRGIVWLRTICHFNFDTLTLVD